jgi:ATP-dependent protease La
MLFKDRKPQAPRPDVLPLLPLRDVVVFPHMVMPLIVGREKSRAALAAAFASGKRIFLVAQKVGRTAEPGLDDIHRVGTIASVIQMLHLPDDNLKVLVEGQTRARLDQLHETDGYLSVSFEELANVDVDPVEAEALVRSVKDSFEQYVKLNKGIPPEMLLTISSIDDAARLSDTLAAQMDFKLEDRQALIEDLQPLRRLDRILQYVQGEIEILRVERKIKTRVKKQMERTQREYYLNEQMQAIQKELGDRDEFKNELSDVERQIMDKPLSDEARLRCFKELRKLKQMSPMSAEATVVRTYIDQVLALPWGEETVENLDLGHAAAILDQDHYGLDKVKDRILEHIAVARLVEHVRGPVLCLVGPPGVGKTSLGRSIARATEREFVRQALGGVRDEAEIRGHRRTYIGALPGKILQCMKKAGSNNPVFLLDEVDKMSADFRGDPSAALLEVLDPEQNHGFNDHYLDLDYDLSKVMFICTANSLEGIPVPLQDRLEIIRLPGYTELEKLAIAERYLIPKQRQANGLAVAQIVFTRQAVARMVRQYTREAGVRSLERQLATACRKVARLVVERGEDTAVRVTSQNLDQLLGVPRYLDNGLDDHDQVGLVKGLAVTSYGGEVLQIEVAVLPGKGKLILTGLLGDWLKESATAGFSYIRSRAEQLGLDPDFHETHDFHVHYPGNAAKADGPSAGTAMATAMVSALTGIPTRSDVAMTGEISLRGRVLAIGGLKEKSLAAHRYGIRQIIIPKANDKDVADIPQVVRDSVEMLRVEHMDQVLDFALRWPSDRARITGATGVAATASEH